MARIRTIKPEFFTSEDIVALSPIARLLYIALWCEADKRGRLAWKPRTFKMRWLPADNCDIEAVCAELIGARLIVLYGDGFAFIPGFEKHQHVNPRETESAFPDPSGWRDAGPKKVGKTLREAVFERDGDKCVRCGSTKSLQADHILPQSCGGPHVIENLRTLCQSCNAGRPVQGAALIADLASDGFTIEQLRVKFGIDASIPDLTHREEGKGREGKGKELPPSAGENPPTEPTPPKPPEQPAQPAAPDPIFGVGLAFLLAKGVPERSARSFLGLLRRDCGSDLAASALLTRAEQDDISDPVAWLTKAAKASKSNVSQLSLVPAAPEPIKASHQPLRHTPRG